MKQEIRNRLEEFVIQGILVKKLVDQAEFDDRTIEFELELKSFEEASISNQEKAINPSLDNSKEAKNYQLFVNLTIKVDGEKEFEEVREVPVRFGKVIDGLKAYEFGFENLLNLSE